MADYNFPADRYAIENEQIKRRLAMAQSISRQAAEPIEAPNVPGARLSPYTALIKALQGGLGGYLGGKASRDEQLFGEKMEKLEQRDLDRMFRGVPVPPVVRPTVGKVLNLGPVPPPPPTPSVSPGAEMTTGPYAIEQGNIDLDKVPTVKNADGTESTVRTITIGQDGVTVLLPTIVNGKPVSDKEAIAEYKKTGKHLGKFPTQKAADDFDRRMHADRGWTGAPGSEQEKWVNEQETLKAPDVTINPALPAALLTASGQMPNPLYREEYTPTLPYTSRTGPQPGHERQENVDVATFQNREAGPPDMMVPKNKQLLLEEAFRNRTAAATRAFEEKKLAAGIEGQIRVAQSAADDKTILQGKLFAHQNQMALENNKAATEREAIAALRNQAPLTSVQAAGLNESHEARWAALHGQGDPMPTRFKLVPGANKLEVGQLQEAFDSESKEEWARQTAKQDRQFKAFETSTKQVYDFKKETVNALVKQAETANGQRENLREGLTLLRLGSKRVPNASAQVAGVIKFLSSVASGEGSGVRITNAELQAIFTARKYGDSLDVWLSGFRGEKIVISEKQVTELRSVLVEMEKTLIAKIKRNDDAIGRVWDAANQKAVQEILAASREMEDPPPSKNLKRGPFVPNGKE